MKNNKEKTLGVILAVAIIKTVSKCKKNTLKHKRRVWNREWLLHSYMYKDFAHLAVKELQLEDPKSFVNFCRLSKEDFEHVLCLVGPSISKQNTIMREPISAATRLLITLRYLATGRTYRDLSESFPVSLPAISILIPETAKAIYFALRDKYLQGCKSASEWKRIAENFYNKWNFPMCLGAIDGKHIAFRAKLVDGSYYYNYKGFNSIILLAVVDANYKFIMVDIGTNGSINDNEALSASHIGEAIRQNTLYFPEKEVLPKTNIKVPYVFISDDAFCLSSRIMKPYSRQSGLEENKTFNYRLTRASRVAEHAFGILATRFKVFQREINLSVEKVEWVTLACCALHNLLCREEKENLSMTLYLTDLEKSYSEGTSAESLIIRNNFRHFFNDIDVLP